ncbi:MAG: YggS family pyridoxal phosphate-dependent enzyme [Cyanobacteria bacterium J083]|nr:MAG: YggS family pyridoxal phosphate-dependent enzyme [Cyanobacteria bacterium J083]
MPNSIAENIASIRQNIPPHVRLIAVSKQKPAAAIREAYACGIRDFAENRWQEAKVKQQELADLSDITWHFIGHIQKNKARQILQHFSWIHSLDSLALALRLNRLAEELGVTPQVLLQFKPLPDPHKYGWEKQQLLADLPQLDQCKFLKIQGLMTILPLGLSKEESLAAFSTTRDLAKMIAQQPWQNIKMTQLSMGMSGDYLEAITAGATMIRLGSIIFGARN